MRWQKVFISHSGDDNGIVELLEKSLSAIGIEPFIAERFLGAGRNIPLGIAENIQDSNIFLPVITENSLGNQWVNQEIGYAYCYSRTNEHPFIIPLVEKDQVDSIKGFLAIPQVTKYVALDLSEPQQTIHELITNLRKYIDRHVLTLTTLTITCPSCSERSNVVIPSQRKIDDAIAKGNPFQSKCTNPKCGNQVIMDPYTLLPMKKVYGYGWEKPEEFKDTEVDFGDGSGLWRIRDSPHRSQTGWIVQFENKAGPQVRRITRTFKTLDELRAILYG